MFRAHVHHPFHTFRCLACNNSTANAMTMARTTFLKEAGITSALSRLGFRSTGNNTAFVNSINEILTEHGFYINAYDAGNVVKSLRKMLYTSDIDAMARIVLKFVEPHTRFLRCFEKQPGKYVMELIEDDILRYTQYRPIAELDANVTYVVLDKDSRACSYYLKPSLRDMNELLRTKVKSMHTSPLKMQIRSMKDDLKGDYKLLMDGIENEATSKGLTLEP